MFIGFGMVVAGVLGLVSLFAGNPSFAEAERALREAGGVVWSAHRVAARSGHLTDRRRDRLRGSRESRAAGLHRHALRSDQGD